MDEFLGAGSVKTISQTPAYNFLLSPQLKHYVSSGPVQVTQPVLQSLQSVFSL